MMKALALLGVAALASAKSTAVRRLAEDEVEATCTGTTMSGGSCGEAFIANKGAGEGFRNDCVGPPNTETSSCTYTPARVVDQCGLLAHQRDGTSPEAKCEAATGCKFTDAGCVRDPKIPLAGMCTGNSHPETDYHCPGLLVPKAHASAIWIAHTSETDYSSTCCEHDMARLFKEIDGNQNGQLSRREADGDYARTFSSSGDPLISTSMWQSYDVNMDGTLSLDEFEVAYDATMNVLSTPASRWLQAHCPEEMDACNADEACYTSMASMAGDVSVQARLTSIVNFVDSTGSGLVDVRECVLRNAKIDCKGEWSPCSASCHKMYNVLLERDEFGFGDVCEEEDGATGLCQPGTDGCHRVVDASIYSVVGVGDHFYDTIPPYEWPDCKRGLAQQKFEYWVDIEPSSCIFDDNGCCEDGEDCPAMPPIFRDCPKPCIGQWSACDPALGNRQQLEYSILQSADEGGAPCDYEDGSIHMVETCPSDCVGICKCDPLTSEYGLFEISPKSNGGMDCPTDSRVETHQHCTDCIGHWEGHCVAGEGAYQTETFVITQEAVHGSPCPFADGETRRIICEQDCVGHWEHKCQSSTERINALHDLATGCGNPSGGDYAAVAAESAADLPSWWPYETADTWTAERGHHIAVPAMADNSGPNVGTIPTIEACENIFAYLVGDKMLSDEDVGDSGPPCGFFFSIDDTPADFTCSARCKAAVDQLVLHCDVYGLSEAHEGRACLECLEDMDRPQDIEGQFGGSQAVAVFHQYDADNSDSLDSDEVGELCELTESANAAKILYCGVSPDGGDTWSGQRINELVSRMTNNGGGDVTVEQFASWWGTTDAFRWNPCPFQQHCSGTHYEVFIHTQTQVGDGDCCTERHGEVRPYTCPAVDCQGEWTGECKAPDEWATAETEAWVTEECRLSQLADVPCSYESLPADGSVQLQFFNHTVKAEQCGASCMFSAGEHRPVRCEFKCVGEWVQDELDNCTVVYETHYVQLHAGDTGDLTCEYEDRERCEESYIWNVAEGRCEYNACGICDTGYHQCGDCCKPNGVPCVETSVSVTPSFVGTVAAPPDVCVCPAPEPVIPTPEPEITITPPPPPPTTPPPPPTPVDEPAPSPECREREREEAEEDPDYFDPCNVPVPEPLAEVEYGTFTMLDDIPGLYSVSSREDSTGRHICLREVEAPEPRICLPEEPEPEVVAPPPVVVVSHEPPPPPPALVHLPKCEVVEIESCTPVDCEACWKAPCCTDHCVEHEIYTYTQEASCGGQECDFPEGLTRPHSCTLPCEGHWEGDCNDPSTEYQEWVVDSGCGCLPAYCADELTLAKVLVDGQTACEDAGHEWHEASCGENCFFEFDYNEAMCNSEAGTFITEATSEEQCRVAAERQGLALGGEGYPFAGTYDSYGCYTYSEGAFEGMAFWSNGEGPLDAGSFKVRVEYTACNLVVAQPQSTSCAAGEVCAHAPFEAVRVRECPKDCEGEWVGDCRTSSQLTCTDLEELYGTSGWTNIHRNVDGRHVCAETDNLQANHFVDDGVMMIGGDDQQSDIGASCRAMMTFPQAIETCECAGARLCTVAELEADVTKGTGCNFDVARVWSSSRAREGTMCPDRQRWTAAGSTEYKERFPTKCRDVSQQLAVRCCADHDHDDSAPSQEMQFVVTQEASKTGKQCDHVMGDTKPLDCTSCGGEWYPECTIEDTEITQTFQADVVLPAKFGADLAHPSVIGMIEPSRRHKDPFCQCGHQGPHAVTDDTREFTCDITDCSGHFDPAIETACSKCDFVNDECAADGSSEEGCPHWATCRNTALPDDRTDGYVSYGTMTLPDGREVSNGICTVTSVFVEDDGSLCSTAQMEDMVVTECPHPIDCEGHWEGTCEDFIDSHDRRVDDEEPTRTSPFRTFRVTQPAMNGGNLCLFEGAEVEDGATIGLDCEYQDCEGEWVGDCAPCGTENSLRVEVEKGLADAKECTFCSSFEPDPQDWSVDQCQDTYELLVSSVSPCGFRLGKDHVPSGPNDYQMCTDECSETLAQFEGSCDLEYLSCVTVQEFMVTQPEILGEPCMSPDGTYELEDGYSTRLLNCAQDCKGEWSNPNADGMCESASGYKARIEATVAQVKDELCSAWNTLGGAAPVSADDLELTTTECQELMDELNGVNSTASCGFKLSIEDVPSDTTLCTEDCKNDIDLVTACAAKYNIWAGAVQYEVYNVAREACNGGSTRTCSGSGQTRQLACASTECNYVPFHGADVLEHNNVPCGMNPPTRDCQGGYRFPVDAEYSEWSECEDGHQTRTCKTEAAFGGDNTACHKESSGAYKIESRPCDTCGSCLGAGDGDSADLRRDLEHLQQRLNAMDASITSGGSGGSGGPATSSSIAESPTVAGPSSQSAVGVAVAAGSAFGLVVVVGVALLNRGRDSRKTPYKTLDEAVPADVPEDRTELTGVRASA